jgi:hypothetical protein
MMSSRTEALFIFSVILTTLAFNLSLCCHGHNATTIARELTLLHNCIQRQKEVFALESYFIRKKTLSRTPQISLQVPLATVGSHRHALVAREASK